MSSPIEVRSTGPLRSGSYRVTVYAAGEPAVDLTIRPDGKTVTLGGDVDLRSGPMPCSGGARSGWRRFRFERKP